MRTLLQNFPNVLDVRLGRDRGSGVSKGYAFVDFASGLPGSGFRNSGIPGLHQGAGREAGTVMGDAFVNGYLGLGAPWHAAGLDRGTLSPRGDCSPYMRYAAR